MAQPNTIADLSAWWKADSLAQTDNTDVTTWTDSSGNGFSATQATAARKPHFRTNCINGLPALEFNTPSADQILVSGASTSFAAQTIIAVIFPTTVTGGAHDIRHSSGTALQFYVGTSDLVLSKHNVSVLGRSDGAVITASTWHIVTADYSDANNVINFYHNGLLAGSDPTTVSMDAGHTTEIGSDLAGSEEYVGLIAEIIVYSRVLTSTERAEVHSYLQDKYDISVTDYISQVLTVNTSPGEILVEGPEPEVIQQTKTIELYPLPGEIVVEGPPAYVSAANPPPGEIVIEGPEVTFELVETAPTPVIGPNYHERYRTTGRTPNTIDPASPSWHDRYRTIRSQP